MEKVVLTEEQKEERRRLLLEKVKRSLQIETVDLQHDNYLIDLIDEIVGVAENRAGVTVEVDNFALTGVIVKMVSNKFDDLNAEIDYSEFSPFVQHPMITPKKR